MEFKFKPQAKSNAKRFLVKTCKIDEASVGEYLTQADGEWGTYVDASGQPVKHADIVAHIEQRAAETTAPAPAPVAEQAAAEPAPAVQEAADEEEAPDTAPSANAFGAFAMAQLTAPSNAAPAEPAKPQRTGATPTAGLRIQKDRPEQNGVRRQSAGSVGDKLWALYDAAGPAITLEQAKKLAQDAGLSTTSAAIALYNWRKFHGIASRTTAKQ